jgi:hypothetical protein
MDPEPKMIEADCITTRHLSLVDDQGRERASLRTATHHGDFVVLDMKDVEGRPRVTIQLSDEGAYFALFTEQNAPAISIGVNWDTGSGITIGRPGDGRPQIMIEVPRENQLGDEPSILGMTQE